MAYPGPNGKAGRRGRLSPLSSTALLGRPLGRSPWPLSLAALLGRRREYHLLPVWAVCAASTWSWRLAALCVNRRPRDAGDRL